MPPTQIQIIRHAEKPADPASRQLSARGLERAQKIAEKHVRLFGTVERLFAAADSDKSVRSLATITPLAKVLDRPIDSDFKSENYEDLAKLLLNGVTTGTSILICWHHDDLPELAHKLGAHEAPAKWQFTVFDRIWRLEFGRDGIVTFKDLPQNLLPGDSTI